MLTFSADRDRGKTLKTKSSARMVPLHPELERLGFVQYVEAVKNERGADGWLFVDVSPQAGEGAKAWGKWFGRYLRETGITDKRKVFHSLRHNFKDALRAGGVPEDLNDSLCGHSNGRSVGRGYGSKEIVHRYGMERLVDAVSKVSYRGLDLSPIARNGP
jgi:integrase